MKVTKEEFNSYIETHFEIVASFYSNPTSKILNKIETEQGRGGMWGYAKYLTDEFEELHKDTVWDGQYFEEIDKFLQGRI